MSESAGAIGGAPPPALPRNGRELGIQEGSRVELLYHGWTVYGLPQKDQASYHLHPPLDDSQAPQPARRDELMFQLMFGTGIRLGSLAALNVEDVDLTAGTLRIHAKGGIEQMVYLNTQLRRGLAGHVRTLADGSGALFRSGHGGRIGTRQVQMRFAHWRDRAGLGRGYTVHSLRHTFATRLYQQTRDLHLVREALGHAGVGTTQRYAAIDKKSLRVALSRLS